MSFPVAPVYNPVPLADLPVDIQKRALRIVYAGMPPAQPVAASPPAVPQCLDTSCDFSDTASSTSESSSEWSQSESLKTLPPVADVTAKVLEGYRVFAPPEKLEFAHYLSLFGIPIFAFYHIKPGRVRVDGVVSTQQELERMCAAPRENGETAVSQAQRKVEDLLNGLPKDVLLAITNLIENRKAATWTHWTTREWHVVYLQEQPRTRLTPSNPSDLKKKHKLRWWLNGAAERVPREYFVIIEGNTAHMDMSGRITKFNKHSNPWASADLPFAAMRKQP